MPCHQSGAAPGANNPDSGSRITRGWNSFKLGERRVVRGLTKTRGSAIEYLAGKSLPGMYVRALAQSRHALRSSAPDGSRSARGCRSTIAYQRHRRRSDSCASLPAAIPGRVGSKHAVLKANRMPGPQRCIKRNGSEGLRGVWMRGMGESARRGSAGASAGR